jgi:hypothetical protein
VNRLVEWILIFEFHDDLGVINGNAHVVVVLVLLLKAECVGSEVTRF